MEPAMNILSERVNPLIIEQDQDLLEARLKHRFFSILTRQTNLVLNSSSEVHSSSTTDSTTTSELTDGTISELRNDYVKAFDTDLRRIAEEMNSIGQLCDCVDVYKCVRKPFVDAYFRRLEKFSVGNLKTDDFKKEIDMWIRAARVCMGVLFNMEKQVYDQIFEGIGTTDTFEVGFIGTVEDVAVQLFKFANALSSIPRHPDKLFKILDLYNVLSDLSLYIGGLFPLGSAKRLKINTPRLLSKLKEVVERTLSDYENSLVHEVPSTILETEATIHRSTKIVMRYVSRILQHKKTLSQLIVSNPSTSFGVPVIPDRELVTPREGQTPLGLHIILIVVVLRFNLEGKSKSYEHPSLVTPDIHQTDQSPLFHLFMMNNVHYIVQHIKGSPELKEIIGDEYMERSSKKVSEEMNEIQKFICERILYCLRHEGLHGSTRVVRERIKMFNARLEEVQRCQPTWVVLDVQLRDELRLSISAELVPAYESFLVSYGSNIDKRKYPNIIKYSVEELRTFISTYLLS